MLHTLLRACAGLVEPERTGETPDQAWGAAARKRDAAWGCEPLPGQATSLPAPRARLREFDQSTAAGLFGASGREGYNLTNRSHCDWSKPKTRRSELRAQPRGRAGQSIPGSSASGKARHPHSDSSWGPRREPAVAVWFSGRSYQSEQHPPPKPPAPPSPETPTTTRLFHRLQSQHERQHLWKRKHLSALIQITTQA